MSITLAVVIIAIVAMLVTGLLITVFRLQATIKDDHDLINSMNKRLVYLVVQSTDVLGLFTSKSIGDLENHSQQLQKTIANMDKPSQANIETPIDDKNDFDPFKDDGVN